MREKEIAELLLEEERIDYEASLLAEMNENDEEDEWIDDYREDVKKMRCWI